MYERIILHLSPFSIFLLTISILLFVEYREEKKYKISKSEYLVLIILIVMT
jgi:hypothetical protein